MKKIADTEIIVTIESNANDEIKKWAEYDMTKGYTVRMTEEGNPDTPLEMLVWKGLMDYDTLIKFYDVVKTIKTGETVELIDDIVFDYSVTDIDGLRMKGEKPKHIHNVITVKAAEFDVNLGHLWLEIKTKNEAMIKELDRIVELRKHGNIYTVILYDDDKINAVKEFFTQAVSSFLSRDAASQIIDFLDTAKPESKIQVCDMVNHIPTRFTLRYYEH